MTNDIYEILNTFIDSLEGQSDEYQKGAHAALKTIIKIGHIGFGGDVVDFADWIKDAMENK